jgi:hypothetical protein
LGMGRAQDGHGWVCRRIRMRTASPRSTVPPIFRRRALPSPQAAVDSVCIRFGAGAQGAASYPGHRAT